MLLKLKEDKNRTDEELARIDALESAEVAPDIQLIEAQAKEIEDICKRNFRIDPKFPRLDFSPIR